MPLVDRQSSQSMMVVSVGGNEIKTQPSPITGCSAVSFLITRTSAACVQFGLSVVVDLTGVAFCVHKHLRMGCFLSSQCFNFIP